MAPDRRDMCNYTSGGPGKFHYSGLLFFRSLVKVKRDTGNGIGRHPPRSSYSVTRLERTSLEVDRSKKVSLYILYFYTDRCNEQSGAEPLPERFIKKICISPRKAVVKSPTKIRIFDVYLNRVVRQYDRAEVLYDAPILSVYPERL